jgi:hypothetical protein
MMKEILGVTDEPRTLRRWFHDDYFDLFVWQTTEGEITLFQLCYGIGSSERALVWHKYGGFFHDGLESARGTEVLGARLGRGAPLSADPIVARFATAADSLPDDVRDFVVSRLREYAETKPVPSRRKQFRREDWQRKPSAAKDQKSAARSAKSGKPVS